MKTRRALQTIVGIISTIVLACLIAGVVCWGLWKIWPDTFAFASPIIEPIFAGFSVIATLLGIGKVWYVVPISAYLLPTLLLLIATILLLSRYKGKMGKYHAGCVLALIAIALITIFTLVFASDLVTGAEQHVWFPSPIEWTAVEMIVRYVALGVLVITLIFVGSALGVKDKTNKVTQSAQANQDTGTAGNQTVASSKPQETPVSDDTREKLNRAKKLRDMGAITQEEYQKIENSYLKK